MSAINKISLCKGVHKHQNAHVWDSPMEITLLGERYNVGEKPTVILYTYINRHAGTPEKQ